MSRCAGREIFSASLTMVGRGNHRFERVEIWTDYFQSAAIIRHK